MKREISIVGVGAHKVGTSKAGRAYDFTEVCISYEDTRFQGHHAETVNLSAEVLEGRIPRPGDIWVVEMYQQNYQTKIACIYGEY